MFRVYSATFEAVTVSAAQDFFELNAPATGACVLLSASIGQYSDPGDAEAEMLRMQIKRSTGTSGSGGSTVTARPHEVLLAVFPGTVDANNTTVATTTTVVRAETWNAQVGWLYQPTPEERLTVAPSGRLVISLPAAPADALSMSGTMTFAFLG